jgi:hypothetical protein
MRVSFRGDAACRVAAAALFTTLLAVGLAVFSDYGLSWDEQLARVAIGHVNFEYIRSGDPGPLLEDSEKYHGPAFELLLVSLEKWLGLTDSRPVFLMRHLVTFLTFYAGVFVFYRLLEGRFGKGVAVCGALFLVLSPRIFAESFYNPKDVVALTLYALCLYTLAGFRRRMTPATATAHALACALLTDVRIPGVVVAGVTVAVTAVDGALAWHRRARGVVRPGCVVLFAGLYAGLTVLFWPVLWEGPVRHFTLAFQEMSHAPGPTTTFYLGRTIPTNDLPWHYVPVWVAVTTPLLYGAFFLVGLARMAVDAVRSPRAFWARPADVPVLLCLFLPLAAVIGVRATLYDGWRHVYFLYAPFLYVATAGLESAARLARAATGRLPAVWPLFAAGVAAALLWTAATMVRDHPFQNVYFNRLAGPDLATARHFFDADYWGLSYRRGLEFVLADSSAPSVVVRTNNTPGELNAHLLPRDQRYRLHFTRTPGEEQYYMTEFRWEPDYVPSREVFAVGVDGGKILVVEKAKPRADAVTADADEQPRPLRIGGRPRTVLP